MGYELKTLSDRELIARADALRKRERTATLGMILHLIEIERRKLHVKVGYATLFDYCTRRLGYSESAANRRIRAARLVREVPEVYGMLDREELTLSTAGLLYGVLTIKNKRELLPRVKGLSYRELEGVLSAYRPGKMIKDRVRPIAVPKPVQTLAPPLLTPAQPGQSGQLGQPAQPGPGKSGKFHTADAGSGTVWILGTAGTGCF